MVPEGEKILSQLEASGLGRKWRMEEVVLLLGMANKKRRKGEVCLREELIGWGSCHDSSYFLGEARGYGGLT